MSSPIRKAVIKRIADQKRCSLSVASYIYACKPIATKQRLCAQEQQRCDARKTVKISDQ